MLHNNTLEFLYRRRAHLEMIIVELFGKLDFIRTHW